MAFLGAQYACASGEISLAILRLGDANADEPGEVFRLEASRSADESSTYLHQSLHMIFNCGRNILISGPRVTSWCNHGDRQSHKAFPESDTWSKTYSQLCISVIYLRDRNCKLFVNNVLPACIREYLEVIAVSKHLSQQLLGSVLGN